jgi:hypothetical protein
MKRSLSKLKRDSRGGAGVLWMPCFAGPRSSKAFLYHATLSRLARFCVSVDSRRVVRMPELGSQVHELISYIIVGQYERLNNSIKKRSGMPWSWRMLLM